MSTENGDHLKWKLDTLYEKWKLQYYKKHKFISNQENEISNNEMSFLFIR
jgi:hypothetical protein